MAKQTARAGDICVIYARYSSHAQNDASIEQQVAECRGYAADHGLQISEVYADRALSGRSDRRPEFQRMMRHAEAGRFQVVLTYKSNRLARNMFDALRYEKKLDGSGVRVIYCKEDFGDNAAGRLALRMMMSINEFYSENMAEDVKRGMLDNARQCKVNGLTPLGYKRGDDGRFAIDEAGAEVVREIFRRVAAGERRSEIIDDLNARHILTGSRRSWNKSSFAKMLTNEKYIGVYKFDSVRVEDGIPPILTRDVFDRVQEILRRRSEVTGRRRDKDVENLLTGKLYCAKCGAPMIGISGTSKNGAVFRYYVCRTRRESRGCDKMNIRKEAIELRVAQELKQRVLQPDVIEWMIDNVLRFQEEARKQSDLASYQERLAEVRRSLDNLVHAIEEGIYSPATKARLEELESEQRELNGLIASEKAKTRTVTREQILFFLDSFRDGDVADPAFQKRLFNTFLIRAYLDDDRLTIEFNHIGDPIEAPLTLADIESADDTVECSYNPSLGSPQQADANTSWSISMIKGVFVLIIFDTKIC